MGSVTTSSPCTPGAHTLPSGSNACAATPRRRQLISPARTGSNGTAPTNAAHTSVPPLTDCTWTSAPTTSCTQRNPSGGSGAPVDPTPRMRWAGGTMRALRHAMRKGALTPNTSTPVSDAIRHNAPRSGQPGSPSNSTMVAPTSRPDTR